MPMDCFLASIRNPDPVIFLEPKRVYRLVKQDVPDSGEALPLDRCFVLREGSDVTLISWGAMLHETQQAANELEKQGVSAEIIDVATIKPLDINTIITSVEKTGHCVIIHEAARCCGVGAEISAQLCEYAFDCLQAPIQRVTGYDTVMPYYALESHYMPSTQKIINTTLSIMEYA